MRNPHLLHSYIERHSHVAVRVSIKVVCDRVADSSQSAAVCAEYEEVEPHGECERRRQERRCVGQEETQLDGRAEQVGLDDPLAAARVEHAGPVALLLHRPELELIDGDAAIEAQGERQTAALRVHL